MGLIKQIEFEDGTSGEFWEVTEMFSNPISNKTTVKVECFLNKAMFDNGKKPMANTQRIKELNQFYDNKNQAIAAFKLIDDFLFDAVETE